EDIVNKADEALKTGEYCVDLRFGHDFPILTLFGYLGLEGAGDRLTMEEARYKWFATDFVPFAANLQMIFYKNKSGNVLVKFLVNEKETLLRGLKPETGPYYKWETVKNNTEGYLRP
ncbi:MAG: histidine-type phosphatase, partial [Bacteroidales bacterium]|nr:histidine-type phosphatase [Bacteroidales bacterium]